MTMIFAGSDDIADNPGFPMSQFLKPFRLHISRNATMVAQQVMLKCSLCFTGRMNYLHK